MKLKINITQNFKKEAKPLLKKYASFGEDIDKLGKELQDNPHLGISLGHNLFKIRIAIGSKGKGKSGGARVISYVLINEETINLISVYDKSDYDTADVKRLLDVVKNEGL